MLRLLQVGLLNEAQMVDAFAESEFGEDIRHFRLGNVPSVQNDEAEEENSTHDATIRAREAYVRHVLRDYKERISLGDIKQGKHEGAADMRRQLIKEFLALIVKEKKCKSCDGISPVYRKEKYVKIFERALSLKERAAMAQAGKKAVDALDKLRTSKNKDGYEDEGIADVDSDDSAAGSEGEGEELDENGDVVMAEPKTKGKTSETPGGREQRFLSTMEVKGRLELLFEKEQEILSLLYNSRPRARGSKPLTAQMFFLQTLMVPPNRFRPEVSISMIPIGYDVRLLIPMFR